MRCGFVLMTWEFIVFDFFEPMMTVATCGILLAKNVKLTFPNGVSIMYPEG